MAKFTKLVNGVVVDLTPDEITALLAEWDRNEKESAKTAYITERSQSYPVIGDQLDAIWKLLKTAGFLEADSDARKLYNEVKTVKEKFPKPE